MIGKNPKQEVEKPVGSLFFELFGITHGICRTVATGLRDEDHAENHPTVGSIVRANETRRPIGICGRNVA